MSQLRYVLALRVAVALAAVAGAGCGDASNPIEPRAAALVAPRASIATLGTTIRIGSGLGTDALIDQNLVHGSVEGQWRGDPMSIVSPAVLADLGLPAPFPGTRWICSNDSGCWNGGDNAVLEFTLPSDFTSARLSLQMKVRGRVNVFLNLHHLSCVFCEGSGGGAGTYEVLSDHFVAGVNYLEFRISGLHVDAFDFEGTVTYTRPDQTAPVITPTITGTLGADGWYTSDVTLTWNPTDEQSTVSSTTGCGATPVNADTQGQTFVCEATSAGGTSSKSVTIKRDASAPVIAFSGGTSYTVDQTIAITCAATDPTSGPASQSCQGASDPAYAAGVGPHTLDASATNGAGLSATASRTYTVTVTAASLSALVNRWVTSSGIANSLTKKLEHGQTGAFINEVEAQSGKKIPADKAAILVQLAGSL